MSVPDTRAKLHKLYAYVNKMDHQKLSVFQAIHLNDIYSHIEDYNKTRILIENDNSNIIKAKLFYISSLLDDALSDVE